MELFGYARETLRRRTSTRSAAACTPTTARATEAAIARAIERCGDYEADYRVVHPDGTVRWVAARGRVLCDQRGPAGADARRGLRHDRRPQRRRAPRARAGDDEHRVLHARSRLALHVRQRRRRADPRPAPRRARRRASSGTAYPETSTAPRATSTTAPPWRPASRAASSSSTRRWTPGSTSARRPAQDGLSVYFHDITDRVRAEQERAGERWRRPAPRPAACRSSAPPARGWPGTLEVDELLRDPLRRRAQRLRRRVVVALDAARLAIVQPTTRRGRATTPGARVGRSRSRSSASAPAPRAGDLLDAGRRRRSARVPRWRCR